jgi:hypothetical protein
MTSVWGLEELGERYTDERIEEIDERLASLDDAKLIETLIAILSLAHIRAEALGDAGNRFTT